jgi:hypothetical protein
VKICIRAKRCRQADERLAYISGFTGSAGFAVITAESAALFSDGRYSLQMQAQTDRGGLALSYACRIMGWMIGSVNIRLMIRSSALIPDW